MPADKKLKYFELVEALEMWLGYWILCLLVAPLGFVVGSVIQAAGKAEFEDGPRLRTQSEARCGFQRVRSIPEN